MGLPANGEFAVKSLSDPCQMYFIPGLMRFLFIYCCVVNPKRIRVKCTQKHWRARVFVYYIHTIYTCVYHCFIHVFPWHGRRVFTKNKNTKKIVPLYYFFFYFPIPLLPAV